MCDEYHAYEWGHLGSQNQGQGQNVGNVKVFWKGLSQEICIPNVNIVWFVDKRTDKLTFNHMAPIVWSEGMKNFTILLWQAGAKRAGFMPSHNMESNWLFYYMKPLHMHSFRIIYNNHGIIDCWNVNTF